MSRAETSVRDLLAASSAWQAWTGAADEVEALDWIHTPAATTETHPLAVIAEEGIDDERFAVDVLGPAGRVLIYVEDEETAETREEGLLDFANHVGAVLADLAASGGLYRRAVGIVDGSLRRSHQNESTATISALLFLDWGVRSGEGA